MLIRIIKEDKIGIFSFFYWCLPMLFIIGRVDINKLFISIFLLFFISLCSSDLIQNMIRIFDSKNLLGNIIIDSSLIIVYIWCFYDVLKIDDIFLLTGFGVLKMFMDIRKLKSNERREMESNFKGYNVFSAFKKGLKKLLEMFFTMK